MDQIRGRNTPLHYSITPFLRCRRFSLERRNSLDYPGLPCQLPGRYESFPGFPHYLCRA